MIYPTDNPETKGKKITEFLEICDNNELIVTKIIFEEGKTVKAELVV